MDLRVNPEALGLGAYQAAIAVVVVLVFAWLVWRAVRAVTLRLAKKTPLTPREYLSFAAPPFFWLVVMFIGSIIFSTIQAYGPRVAIPRTKLKVGGQTASETPGIRDLTPKKTTDEERVLQQRKLEQETKARVNLKK